LYDNGIDYSQRPCLREIFAGPYIKIAKLKDPNKWSSSKRYLSFDEALNECAFDETCLSVVFLNYESNLHDIHLRQYGYRILTADDLNGDLEAGLSLWMKNSYIRTEDLSSECQERYTYDGNTLQ
jgi:hypothetical protein